jgi:hypothetical protein
MEHKKWNRKYSFVRMIVLTDDGAMSHSVRSIDPTRIRKTIHRFEIFKDKIQ